MPPAAIGTDPPQARWTVRKGRKCAGGGRRAGRRQNHDNTVVEVRTIIGVKASGAQARAVEDVLRRNGFSGSCEPDVGAQGEGVSLIVVQTSVSTFLSVFLTPVAEGATDRLKRFFSEMHDARDDTDAHLRQIYIRPDAVTPEDWERTRPHGRLPGWPKARPTEPSITLSDSMSDEAWAAVFDVDFDSLEPGSYSWSEGEKAWRRNPG